MLATGDEGHDGGKRRCCVVSDGDGERACMRGLVQEGLDMVTVDFQVAAVQNIYVLEVHRMRNVSPLSIHAG